MTRFLLMTEIDLIKPLAEAFFVESGLPGRLNYPHWKNTWENLIARDIGAILVNEYQKDLFTGILGSLFFPCTMTAELEALEGFFFVSPEYRGGLGAARMLKAYEAEAIRRGCRRIKMVHLDSLNPELAAGIYAKMGYERTQTNYCKELV